MSGRSGRAEYWALVAILFALSFALSFLPHAPIVSAGGAVAIALAQARRLHDMGRSGWWAAAATVAPVAAMLALVGPLGLDGAFLAGSVLMLALLTLVGAVPGTPGPNRFGRPAPFTWLRLLRGR